MRKHFKVLGLMLSVALAVSCGKSNNDNTGGVDVDLDDAISQAESRRAADPDAKGGNTCLLDFNEKYDQYLTEDLVISVTGFSKDVMDFEYSKALKNPAYHSVSYKFKNKRRGKVQGLDMELELKDAITITSIKPMSMNDFSTTYKVVTDEQLKVANQTIDDVVDGKIEDKEVAARLKEAEERGIDKKTTKGAIGVMKGAFEKVGKSYTPVEGLGDAATWNTYSNNLNVLQNGVQFELSVDVSNDQEKNREVAIAIAKLLLKKCK
jgi:hypothetical protein